MKKRILSAILCLAMVSTLFITPIAAAVNLESPAAIADNASMSLIAPNGNNVFVCFDDVTEDATVTFYFNPGANYNTSTPPFLFSLCNDATAGNRIASLYSAVDVDKTVYLNAEGRGIYWWTGYRGATAQPVVLQEWNRVDLQIDFANKQVTGYFNYVKLETVPFIGDFTSFNSIMIHNDKGGYQPNSTCYMDNLIITKGLNDPKVNDVASAVTAEKLAANKDIVLHAQTFDAATTTINLGNATFSAGNIATPQTNSGFVNFSTTVGMTAADVGVFNYPEIADNSSLYMLCPNQSKSYYFNFGEITENATLTFYYRPGENYLTDVDAFQFHLYDTYGGTKFGGFASNANECGGTLYMHTADRNHAWSGSNSDLAKPIYVAEWNRVDLVIDFDNNKITGYVNYEFVETVDFMADVDSLGCMVVPPIKNGYRGAKQAWIDNLTIRKGVNAPVKGDAASVLTDEKIEANITDYLLIETFDTTTTFSHTAILTTPGSVSTNHGNAGFFAIDKTIGMTATSAEAKPKITVADGSSLRLLVPNSGGQFRIYFGDVTKSATLTWYIYTPKCYADLQDALSYKLFDGDTFVGGWESNPWGGQGMHLHMNTATADQGAAWSGATGANTSGKLTADEWSRVDLVVDFDNNTITGYVNYKAIQTLAIPEDASFDHLRIAGYKGGFQGNKYLFIDSLMLREGANVPSRSDVAANANEDKINAANDIIAYYPFNGTTNIVHGTTATEFKANTVYNWRADANSGFCSISNATGLTTQKKDFAYQGHQDTLAAGGENFAVRFVGTVLDYEQVYGMGFDIKLNDGTTKEYICSNVYDKLLGSVNGVDIEYSAIGDFQTGNIYALTLTGLALDQTYAFEITPFTYALDGETKTTGETYTVTYVNGVLQ